jgi:hypothetical protein
MRQYIKFYTKFDTQHRLYFFIKLASLFFSTLAHANYPLPPRFSANAYASDYTIGNADLLIPINSNYCTHNLYIDPMAEYGSDNQGYVDLGLGYRWIQNKAAILGGYLFAGRDRVDNNAHLWVFSPGIEALGSRWDAHLNAYIVGGARNKTIGAFLGSELGFDTVHVSGHTRYDTLFALTQHTGHGADIQVAYQLFPESSLKGYLGSYFFAPSHASNIWGGAAGLEYWLHENVKVFAAYNYDNLRHSTGALGLGVEFGGARIHRSDPYLEERLTDPVKRYVAELGHGSIPSRKKLQPALGTGLNGTAIIPIQTNIAFFSVTAPTVTGALTLANCTAENPCGAGNLAQADIDLLNTLLPDTIMTLGPGDYIADPSRNNVIELHPGQSLIGNNEDHTGFPLPDHMVVIHGEIQADGNNIIEEIELVPTPITEMEDGIFVPDSPNVMLIRDTLGIEGDPLWRPVHETGNASVTITDTDMFSQDTGVLLEGTSKATIIRNTINVHTVTNIPANGIYSTADTSIVVDDSRINCSGTTPIPVTSAGISGSPNVTITNSQLNANGSNGSGIVAGGVATFSITSTSINVQGTGNLFGIQALTLAATGGVSASGVDITVSNTATSTTDNSASIFVAGHNSPITIDGASLLAEGPNAAIRSSETSELAKITITNAVCSPASPDCP